MDDVAVLVERTLLGGLAPLWILSGFADWACHRRLRIEHTAGLGEALLHLTMLAELGVGLLAALLLELNAGAFALMLGAALAHEVTVWIDLSYAESRRRIPWFEQWVHGLQQSLPWIGLIALALLEHEQALAMLGIGTAAPDWVLRPKSPGLPAWYLASFFGAALLFVGLPFLGETRRAWRARGAARPARGAIGRRSSAA